MSNIFKLLNLPIEVKQEGLFGVEIEVEGQNLPDVQNPVWKTEKDGSLRDGLEYIFVKPLAFNQVQPAITQLQNSFKNNSAKLAFSFRTSVHVHMNVQDVAEDQLLNIIYTYLLLENCMMEYCGEERKGNRFCLRLQDAEGVLISLEKIFEMGAKHIPRIRRDNIRYASMNLEALNKYGSLEFRGLAGTLKTERIVNWCGALSSIKEYACSKKSPIEILNEFMSIRTEAFVKKVLGEYYSTFNYEGLSKDVIKNFSLSIDLPNAYRKLEKTRLIPKKPNKTIKPFADEAELDRLKGRVINHVIRDDLVDNIQRIEMGQNVVIKPFFHANLEF